MGHRIALVGGASTYVPLLVNALANVPGSAITADLCLMDQKVDRLRVIGDFCKELVQRSESRIQISTTSSLDQALERADIVITMYRSGGLEARHLDESIGLEHGVIGQETQGFGGFASALRNIAVLKTIVAGMKKSCPNAWLVNITNPTGILTRAGIELGAKSIGICELPYKMRLAFASSLGVPSNSVEISYVGLNHLGWVYDVHVNRESVLDTILDHHLEEVLESTRAANIPLSIEETTWVRSLRAIPSPYLSYYYQREQILDLLKRDSRSRAEDVMAINDELMSEYESLSFIKWQDLARKRGGYPLGDATGALVAEMLNVGPKGTHVILTQNHNTIGELPTSVVIETPVTVIDGEPKPVLHANGLNKHMLGLISIVAAYEALTVQAGISGDYGVALQALGTHPLVPTTRLAEKLLDTALDVFNPYLPQFN